MTANAFMSGSLAPPLVVVSVGKKARMHARLATARRFGISILDQAQEPASRHFAGQAVAGFRRLRRDRRRPRARPGGRGDRGAGEASLPAAATTPLYVGEVRALAVNDAAPPLLFYAGRYAMLQAAPEPEEAARPTPSFF